MTMNIALLMRLLGSIKGIENERLKKQNKRKNFYPLPVTPIV